MLLDGQVDAVTFTSPDAVRRFASLIGEEQAADLLGTTVVAAIGPVTAAAAMALGIKPTVDRRAPTRSTASSRRSCGTSQVTTGNDG